MATQKITCPVCFTNMNLIGHDMVCPECGYKYCGEHVPYTYDDHNHNDYKSYNVKTTYSSGYDSTSSQSAAPSSQYSSVSQSTAPSSQYSSASQSTALKSQYSSASAGQSSSHARSSASTGQQTALPPSPAANQRYAAAQRKQTAKKSKSSKFIVFIICLIFILQIGRALFAQLSINEEDVKSSIEKLLENLYSAVERNNSKNDSSNEKSTSAPGSDATAEDVIAYYKSLKQPQTLFQDLLCHVSSKSINKVTLDDCKKISDIQIFRDEEVDRLCVLYGLTDSTSEYYYPDAELIDTAELKVFRNLEKFRAVGIVNMFFKTGDLNGLTLLNSLECSNTPRSLSQLLEDPGQLQNLKLNSSEIAFDVSGLEEFQNLYALTLYSPIGIEGEKSIGELRNLTDLNIYVTTKPQDYSFLESLTNLINLQIRAVHLRDLSFLESLPNLTSLEICDSESLEDLTPIGGCSGLTELSLRSLESATDYSPLASLTNLEYLCIDNGNLDDVLWMTTLNNLFRLDVENNNITDLSPLAQLQSLQELRVSGNPVLEYGNLDRSVIKDEVE